MHLEFYEKDGRLWQRHVDPKWKPPIIAEGPTRIEIVKDPAIDEFIEFVRRSDVTRAMIECKTKHAQ